jgi:hypothetical protein
MSREMSLIILGLATIIIPYTGFPSAWRTALLVVVGAAVAVIGFLLRGETLSKPSRHNEHHPFQESARPISDIRTAEPASSPTPAAVPEQDLV